MNQFEYWKLCERLNIVQAALLMCDCDPSDYQDYIEIAKKEFQPPGYYPCKSALIAALESGVVQGDIVNEVFGVDEASPIEDVNLLKSYVVLESLTLWLKSKSFQNAFFFPDLRLSNDFENSDHECFAPKLAAAVAAWTHASNNSFASGTPKQKIAAWVRKNAHKYKLTDGNGKPNETAINEIAKVANWRPQGGAPKTPGNK